MTERYADARSVHKKDAPDFIKRRHGFPIWWLISSFIIVFLAIVAVTYLYAPAVVVIIAIVSAFLLGGLAYFTSIYIHNSRDIIMATEFQNALFSGAMRANSEFCLIVKGDGTLIYSDVKYNKRFADPIKEGLRGVDALLAHEGLAPESKERILRAMSYAKADIVPFEIENEGKSGHVFIRISPIALRQTEPDTASKALPEIGYTEHPGAYMFLQAVSIENDTPSDWLNMLPSGFYALNADDSFFYVNDTFAGIVGQTADTLIASGKPLGEIVKCFDGRHAQELLKESYSGPVSLTSVAGEVTHATLSQIVIQKGDDKQRVGLVTPFANTVAIDSDSELLMDGWRCFIEHSPIAIAQLDERGNILKSNYALRALAGKNEDQLQWNLLDIIDEGKEEVVTLLKRVVTTPSHEEKPIDITISGESGATASLYLGRMESADGSSAGVIAHLIDTTEQKNLELRFVHSQKMQAVGQLAGGIAHDFNNLLTAMMGFCDLLLLRHPAGDPSFADIMQIKQNANRAANLVRQLLAFSRKQTLQPEVLDITDVLAELSNLIRRLIGENIELKMNHGRDLGLIRVDQGQLEQVLINLAVNARDAMTDGGVLTVQTNNVTVDREHPISRQYIAAEGEVIEDGDYVLVEVIDTGHGIPKDIIEKIFEPFFSTKEMGSGTGLGLATVYGIIKQTGGYVYVSSEEGMGTKFGIFLKSYSAEEANQTKIEEDASERINVNADLTGKGTLLLVEDEAPVRIFSAQALGNKGYTVLEADSGEAALEIVAKRGDEIEAIITDVIMPGMNGPSMAEEVVKQYPDIKVIFISGYAEDAFVKTYGTERKFNFLPKPFTLKQLASKVKDVLEQDGSV